MGCLGDLRGRLVDVALEDVEPAGERFDLRNSLHVNRPMERHKLRLHDLHALAGLSATLEVHHLLLQAQVLVLLHLTLLFFFLLVCVFIYAFVRRKEVGDH